MNMSPKSGFRVLIVDDQDAIHDDFHQILQGDIFRDESLIAVKRSLLGSDQNQDQSTVNLPNFQLDSAHQGEAGLAAISEAKAKGDPYALAFVDMRMPPGWDGIETAQRMLAADKHLQIVLCTAHSDYSIGEILARFQGASRVLLLKKPFDAAEVCFLAVSLTDKWRMSKETQQLLSKQAEHIADSRKVISIVQSCHNELETAHQELQDHADYLSERLQERTIELLGTRDLTMFALAQLAESRDPETGEHLRRMQAYAQRLCDHLAVNSRHRGHIDKVWLDNFYRSTPLHDIGKVGIPDHVLLKPGKLTDEEFEIMKKHTLIGAEALERAANQGSGAFLTMAADIARHHHERWDGGGYPYGLSGNDIPLCARITSVADVFDALTSARVYKEAMSVETATRIIREGKGGQFDPEIIEAFEVCLEDFVEIKDRIDGDAA